MTLSFSKDAAQSCLLKFKGKQQPNFVVEATKNLSMTKVMIAHHDVNVSKALREFLLSFAKLEIKVEEESAELLESNYVRDILSQGDLIEDSSAMEQEVFAIVYKNSNCEAAYKAQKLIQEYVSRSPSDEDEGSNDEDEGEEGHGGDSCVVPIESDQALYISKCFIWELQTEFKKAKMKVYDTYSLDKNSHQGNFNNQIKENEYFLQVKGSERVKRMVRSRISQMMERWRVVNICQVPRQDFGAHKLICGLLQQKLEQAQKKANKRNLQTLCKLGVKNNETFLYVCGVEKRNIDELVKMLGGPMEILTETVKLEKKEFSAKQKQLKGTKNLDRFMNDEMVHVIFRNPNLVMMTGSRSSIDSFKNKFLTKSPNLVFKPKKVSGTSFLLDTNIKKISPSSNRKEKSPAPFFLNSTPKKVSPSSNKKEKVLHSFSPVKLNTTPMKVSSPSRKVKESKSNSPKLNSSKQYCYGDDVGLEEDLHHEFKEIKNSNVANITAKLQKYCAAFLNTEGGSIFFGVHDDGRVLGVSLNKGERDKIRLFIDCMKFSVSTVGLIRVKFINVVGTDDDNLCVAKVIVQMSSLCCTFREKTRGGYHKPIYVRRNAGITEVEAHEYMQLKMK